MGDFSKGGVHKTDGFWIVFYYHFISIIFFCIIKRPGRLIRQILYIKFEATVWKLIIFQAVVLLHFCGKRFFGSRKKDGKTTMRESIDWLIEWIDDKMQWRTLKDATKLLTQAILQ